MPSRLSDRFSGLRMWFQQVTFDGCSYTDVNIDAATSSHAQAKGGINTHKASHAGVSHRVPVHISFPGLTIVFKGVRHIVGRAQFVLRRSNQDVRKKRKQNQKTGEALVRGCSSMCCRRP